MGLAENEPAQIRVTEANTGATEVHKVGASRSAYGGYSDEQLAEAFASSPSANANDDFEPTFIAAGPGINQNLVGFSRRAGEPAPSPGQGRRFFLGPQFFEQGFNSGMEGFRSGDTIEQRLLGLGVAALSTYPMLLESTGRAAFNVPSHAGNALEYYGAAFSATTNEDRIMALLYGTSSLGAVSLGAMPFVPMGRMAPLTAQERAIGGFPGEAAIVEARTTYNVTNRLGGFSQTELGVLRGAGLSDAEIARQVELLGDVNLFRGTSSGFPGNPVFQKFGISSASTDPAVATIFALESRALGGNPILLFGERSRFGSGIDLGNVRKVLEREVQVEMSPSEFAARAPYQISADVARQTLSDMGVVKLPSMIRNSQEATQLLQSTPKLTPEQIQEFLLRARPR